MNNKQWLLRNACSLQGKTVAITGATGDLGREICRAVLFLSGSLLLLDRSPEKDRVLMDQLTREYPGAEICSIPLDLSDLESVNRACSLLSRQVPDVLVHNAGVYDVPRFTCSTGLDNIFEINFAAPYYLTKQLLPQLAAHRSKVVVMGSLAHNYRKTDPEDLDLAGCKHCHLVYGNSKRYLMFAFSELMKTCPDVDFAIAHPGVSFTNISNHYPKPIFMLIRYPMKILFPRPPKAVRGMILAICKPLPPDTWIGPPVLHTWGNPRIQPLKTCREEERKAILRSAEQMYLRRFRG